MAAVGTLIQMTSQGSRPASYDGQQHFLVQPGEPGGRSIEKSVLGSSNQNGQLHEWPLHLFARCVSWV